MLLVLDVHIKRRVRNIKHKLDPKIKWCRLKTNQKVLVDRHRQVQDVDWNIQDDSNAI